MIALVVCAVLGRYLAVRAESLESIDTIGIKECQARFKAAVVDSILNGTPPDETTKLIKDIAAVVVDSNASATDICKSVEVGDIPNAVKAVQEEVAKREKTGDTAETDTDSETLKRAAVISLLRGIRTFGGDDCPQRLFNITSSDPETAAWIAGVNKGVPCVDPNLMQHLKYYLSTFDKSRSLHAKRDVSGILPQFEYPPVRHQPQSAHASTHQPLFLQKHQQVKDPMATPELKHVPSKASLSAASEFIKQLKLKQSQGLPKAGQMPSAAGHKAASVRSSPKNQSASASEFLEQLRLEHSNLSGSSPKTDATPTSSEDLPPTPTTPSATAATTNSQLRPEVAAGEREALIKMAVAHYVHPVELVLFALALKELTPEEIHHLHGELMRTERAEHDYFGLGTSPSRFLKVEEVDNVANPANDPGLAAFLRWVNFRDLKAEEIVDVPGRSPPVLARGLEAEEGDNVANPANDPGLAAFLRWVNFRDLKAEEIVDVPGRSPPVLARGLEEVDNVANPANDPGLAAFLRWVNFRDLKAEEIVDVPGRSPPVLARGLEVDNAANPVAFYEQRLVQHAIHEKAMVDQIMERKKPLGLKEDIDRFFPS